MNAACVHGEGHSGPSRGKLPCHFQPKLHVASAPTGKTRGSTAKSCMARQNHIISSKRESAASAVPFLCSYSSWPSTNTAPLESALLCRATMPCLKAQRALAKPFACSVLHWHGGRASSSRFAWHTMYRPIWSSKVPQQVLGDKPVGSMRYVSQCMR